MRCKTALHSLIFPGMLVAVPILGLWLWAPQPNFLTPLLPTIATLLLVASLMLCWRFSCSILLLLCGVMVAHGGVLIWAPELLPGWRLLLPLNLLVLSLLRERPVFSLSILGRLVFLVVQPAILYLLAEWFSFSYQRVIALHWDVSLPRISYFVDIGLYSVVVVCVAVALLAKVLWRPTMETSVMLWALLLFCTAQQSAVQTIFSPVLLYGLLALIILVSILERSYGLAFRDELTGLPSRRAFLDQVNRRPAGYSLAIVDIDHFKKVNDTHGHDVGDQVLKLVAARLASVTKGGKAFRYGGEEFVILFYHKDSQDIEEAVEQLRQNVADTPFVLRQKPRPAKKPRHVVTSGRRPQGLRVTVSIGLALWQKRLVLNDIVKRADQALYRAKKTGRNRVVKA